VFRGVVLVLLAVDGVLCAVATALFLPSYLGSIWFPISAPVAGVVNTALVWAAMNCSTSNRQAALPLITWFATIGVLALGGPGGDIVLRGAGIGDYGPLLLLIVGAAPAVWLLWLRGPTSPRRS